MNQLVIFLSLLCGFLMGVIAGPWLWPREMRAQPIVESLAPAPEALAHQALPPPPPPPAPEPQVDDQLHLKGVLVGMGEGRSRALIALGTALPKSYKMDDKLPDGSVLKDISGKSVDVEKNGETRTLALERGTASPTEEDTTIAEIEPAAATPTASTETESAVAEPATAAPAGGP